MSSVHYSLQIQAGVKSVGLLFLLNRPLYRYSAVNMVSVEMRERRRGFQR